MTDARIIGTPFYYNCIACDIELLDHHARLTGRCVKHSEQTQGFPISHRAVEDELPVSAERPVLELKPLPHKAGALEAEW